MPRFPVALAALNTPAPEPPAAAKMMSMPSSYMPVAMRLALRGVVEAAVKSGGSVMYLAVTVAAGLAALTPASKPAWNVWISGTLTPPMKPTLLVLVFLPAATPTRYEPCSAAKVSDATFGTSTSELSSTMREIDLRVRGGDLLQRAGVGEPDAR